MIRNVLRGNAGVLLSIILTCIPCFFQSYAQTVSQADGSVVLRKADKNITIAKGADNALPVAGKDEVFYVQRTQGGADKIVAYKTATGQAADIVTMGMKAVDGNVLKGTIVNLVYDKDNNRLFIANKDTYGDSDKPMYLTWYYDATAKALHIFKDGRVTTVGDGKIEVVIDDIDLKGHYTQKSSYTTAGRIIRAEERIYN